MRTDSARRPVLDALLAEAARRAFDPFGRIRAVASGMAELAVQAVRSEVRPRTAVDALHPGKVRNAQLLLHCLWRARHAAIVARNVAVPAGLALLGPFGALAGLAGLADVHDDERLVNVGGVRRAELPFNARHARAVVRDVRA